jgi:hypothetical protein
MDSNEQERNEQGYSRSAWFVVATAMFLAVAAYVILAALTYSDFTDVVYDIPLLVLVIW